MPPSQPQQMSMPPLRVHAFGSVQDGAVSNFFTRLQKPETRCSTLPTLKRARGVAGAYGSTSRRVCPTLPNTPPHIYSPCSSWFVLSSTRPVVSPLSMFYSLRSPYCTFSFHAPTLFFGSLLASGLLTPYLLPTQISRPVTSPLSMFYSLRSPYCTFSFHAPTLFFGSLLASGLLTPYLLPTQISRPVTSPLSMFSSLRCPYFTTHFPCPPLCSLTLKLLVCLHMLSSTHPNIPIRFLSMDHGLLSAAFLWFPAHPSPIQLCHVHAGIPQRSVQSVQREKRPGVHCEPPEVVLLAGTRKEIVCSKSIAGCRQCGVDQSANEPEQVPKSAKSNRTWGQTSRTRDQGDARRQGSGHVNQRTGAGGTQCEKSRDNKATGTTGDTCNWAAAIAEPNKYIREGGGREGRRRVEEACAKC